MPQGHYPRDQERESVRFGILLPTRRLVMEGGRPGQFKEIVSLAQTAEHARLDSVWVGDSLTAKPRLEPLSTLTAVAMETERVRLGTAVLLPALRHPVHLAHQVATLDFISGGRLILGAGVGGTFNEAQRTEWSHAGVNVRTRASRFEEVVEIVTRLTSGETLDFDGEHFSLEGASIAPKSPQDGGVPFLIASHWRAGRDVQFGRAARLGSGIISISDYPDEYAKVVGRVEHHTLLLSRDPAEIEKTFYMTVNLGPDAKESATEADRFLKLYYGMNFWGDRWGPYGPAELTVERISKYREAGAETMIVRFAAFDQETQLHQFLEDVVPNFA
ncbi:MAG: LLM class flavin-dependent oxidoreductase [Dehalococcoidia bacterium]|nr:LLM class flavin-dependent oxidoreductase [Dehalococcoidia bacterium]